MGILAFTAKSTRVLLTQRSSRGVLCTRGERPRNCRAAEECDELAPFHYSITSSARASSVGGTVRPSALAVVKLQ